VSSARFSATAQDFEEEHLRLLGRTKLFLQLQNEIGGNQSNGWADLMDAGRMLAAERGGERNFWTSSVHAVQKKLLAPSWLFLGVLNWGTKRFAEKTAFFVSGHGTRGRPAEESGPSRPTTGFLARLMEEKQGQLRNSRQTLLPVSFASLFLPCLA